MSPKEVYDRLGIVFRDLVRVYLGEEDSRIVVEKV